MRQLLQTGSSIFFRRHNSVLSAAFVIMVTYALSLIVGLFKQRLLTAYFLSSQAPALDAYNAAFSIPDTLFQVFVVGSLSAGFIPIFNRYSARSQTQGYQMVNSALNLLLLIFIPIIVLVSIFALPLSRLTAPGFSGSQVVLMAGLLRTMMIAQFFFCISGFLTGIIQSHQRFLIPAIAPIIYNLSIVLGIVFLSPMFGVAGPAIGVVLGALLHMLIQLPLARKLGFRFRFIFNPRHPGVLEIIRFAPPRALALGIDQIEQFVAIVLASLLAAGSISLFKVAFALYTLPTTLFGLTVGQAALPQLSKDASSSNLVEFWHTLTTCLLQIAFFALPVSTLLIVLRIPVVRLIFGSSTFPWPATLLTGQTAAVLVLSATFAAILQLLVRAFYALHDTTTPLYIGLFSALFNVTFGLVATQVFHWGIVGIAAAISTTSIIETSALFFFLSRHSFLSFHRLSNITTPLSKMITISFATGLTLWVFMRQLDKILDTSRTVSLIILTFITTLAGLGLYLGLSSFFKIQQFASVIHLLRRLSDWRSFLAPQPLEPLISPTSEQD